MSRSRTPLTAHFRVNEFDCRDGRTVPSAAVDALRWWCQVWGEPLRAAFGPVRVTSGYRPADYNASVGGAALSYHVYDLRYGPRARPGLGKGVAADVVPASGNPALWAAWAVKHLDGLRDSGGTVQGVSIRGRGAAVPYPRSGFIHLDTGPARSWAG